MKYLRSNTDVIFDYLNTLIMVGVILVTLYPFWHSLIGSFNEGLDYVKGGVYFWPRKFTLENYAIILERQDLGQAYLVTIARTVIGTLLHLAVVSVFAYGFSRKNLKFRKFYAAVCIIPMFFSGGLIPMFLVLKTLRLLDSFWVYVIPRLFAFWNVLIITAFFKTIPDSLNESARMDGAYEYTILFRIILPLSKPVLMAILLFTAVGHWNSFFDSLVFIPTKEHLRTLQHYLMIVIVRSQDLSMNRAQEEQLLYEMTLHSETVKLATMMITAGPILLVYPFVQKHFVKGVMIGSIKG